VILEYTEVITGAKSRIECKLVAVKWQVKTTITVHGLHISSVEPSLAFNGFVVGMGSTPNMQNPWPSTLDSHAHKLPASHHCCVNPIRAR
jgi:hypothetical protein